MTLLLVLLISTLALCPFRTYGMHPTNLSSEPVNPYHEDTPELVWSGHENPYIELPELSDGQELSIDFYRLSLNKNSRSDDEIDLLPGNWINSFIIDDIINYFILSYQKQDSILYIPSSAYEYYSSALDDVTLIFQTILKDRAIEKEVILVVINTNPTVGSHWILGVIQMKLKKIIIFDSMYDSLSKSYRQFKKLIEFVYYIYTVTNYYHKTKLELDISEWSFLYAEDALQQDNASDCGLFVCVHAFSFIANDYFFKPPTPEIGREWLFYNFLKFKEMKKDHPDNSEYLLKEKDLDNIKEINKDLLSPQMETINTKLGVNRFRNVYQPYASFKTESTIHDDNIPKLRSDTELNFIEERRVFWKNDKSSEVVHTIFEEDLSRLSLDQSNNVPKDLLPRNHIKSSTIDDIMYEFIIGNKSEEYVLYVPFEVFEKCYVTVDCSALINLLYNEDAMKKKMVMVVLEKHDHHFVLGIIHVEKRCIAILDSWYHKNKYVMLEFNALTELAHYMNTVSNYKHKTNFKFFRDHWDFVYANDALQQKREWDSGLYVCMHAYSFIHHARFFTIKSSTAGREWLFYNYAEFSKLKQFHKNHPYVNKNVRNVLLATECVDIYLKHKKTPLNLSVDGEYYSRESVLLKTILHDDNKYE